MISHGNGPQVGSINLGLNYAAEHDQGPAFPFAECGAMSQAYIGYQLQESLQNELHSMGIDKQVVTLVTQVEVDEAIQLLIVQVNPSVCSTLKKKQIVFNRKKVINL